MLFSLGGLFSLYEGWHKLGTRKASNNPWVAVGMLVFGLVAETMSMRACLQEINKVRGDRKVWRWFRETGRASWSSSSARISPRCSAWRSRSIAVLMTWVTGNPMWDGLGWIGSAWC